MSGAVEEPEVTEKPEDEVIVPHDEAVTIESFLAWREQFEAELALEQAKRCLSLFSQYFESGRHSTKGATVVAEGSEEEEEEDIDFDEDFEGTGRPDTGTVRTWYNLKTRYWYGSDRYWNNMECAGGGFHLY
ncbi:hypothetical protein FCM35_KLT16749 [Carex littledalei]|uniref:Uncharacterized protein n=1 Tax=Carex littledalei TaxID=544730 RepID=A0A833RQD1_9POAL|nr:hypothetical protein FCM35_KLT16749 [Carex littledalei]